MSKSKTKKSTDTAAMSAVYGIELSGKWLCALGETEPDFANSAETSLPGSLDDFGLGEPVTEPETGALSRKVKYTGKAWFRREFSIPDEWKGYTVELLLERVIWESEVWVDNEKIDSVCDSLAAPHIHILGQLEPGRHLLTLCIDNSMKYNIGDKGHAYCDYMQTIWNGVVGGIKLRLNNPLNLLKVTAPWPTDNVVLKFPKLDTDTWKVVIREFSSEKIMQESALNIAGTPDCNFFESVLPLSFEPESWDEFSPFLYELTLTALKDDRTAAEKTVRFGFRSVERKGNCLYINGYPLFLRGNLDNCHFPLMGYPATSETEWKRIMSVYKENGINFIRFHSWCPPEAAFSAADELGIYVQPETLWIDAWMPGGLKGLGQGDEKLDSFIRCEMRRINDTYGNSPSYISFSFGNELGSSNFKKMSEWIGEEKKYDSRRLYSCSTARSVTNEDDLMITHHYPGVGDVRMRMFNNINWDYEDVYSKTELPCIGHEIGQWPVYPDWNEIEKYTGNLSPENLKQLREISEKNGTIKFNKLFHRVSAKQSILMYKDEVESFLRTPSCAGITLLGLQDYSGQGEALVGWYDSFYDSKNSITPKEARAWLAPVVILAKFAKYCWKTNETYIATLLVRNHSKRQIEAATEIKWSVLKKDKNRTTLFFGLLKIDKPVPPGALFTVGTVELPLHPLEQNSYELEAVIDGLTEKNSWPFWVFEEEKSIFTQPPEVLFTDDLESAITALKQGGKVILNAFELGNHLSATSGEWGALTWSATWFGGQELETLGLCIDTDHPALKGFPTEEHGNWQWWNICRKGKAFRLTGISDSCRPIAMPVSDFHKSELLGTIFEARLGTGSLLVSGYDLSTADIETQTLKHCLLEYVAGPQFNPRTEVDFDWLEKLLRPSEASSIKPPEFKNAYLYISCGANCTSGNESAWHRGADLNDLNNGINYHVDSKVNTGCWTGEKISFTIQLENPVLGKLLVWFDYPDHTARGASGEFEGRRFTIPNSLENEGHFILELHIDREDCLDKTLSFSVQTTSNQSLRISQIALLPR